jgi:nicotinamidase-related amidase
VVEGDPPGFDDQLLLAGGVQPVGDHEVVIYKPRWGAFYGTPLDDHLRDAGVTTLVFAGCNFPNCPRTSIYEASERDYRIVLTADAVSGVYDRGIAELRSIGVASLSTDEVLAALEAAGSELAPAPGA